MAHLRIVDEININLENDRRLMDLNLICNDQNPRLKLLASSLKHIFSRKLIACCGAGASIEEWIDIIKDYQDKMYIFVPLQMYRKFIELGIRVDGVFCVEINKPKEGAFLEYYNSMKELTDEYPIKNYFVPMTVTPELFNLRSEAIITWLPVATQIGQAVFNKNWSRNDFIFGGSSVINHMFELCIRIFKAIPLVFGADFCYYKNKARAFDVLGCTPEDRMELPCWGDEHWQTSNTYFRAIRDMELLVTGKSVKDYKGLQTTYYWCSPGVKIKGVKRLSSREFIIDKLSRQQDVKQLPFFAGEM